VVGRISLTENDKSRFLLGGQMPTEAQKNVVVVEDDASVRRAILRLLHAAGQRAIGFPSAEALLKALVVAEAGCLVLDISLPGLSGFELYQRLLESHWKLPVIFITGNESPSTAEWARKLDAIAYLVKPISEEDLLDAITRGLSLGDDS
jgi:FixJ family two-component response regulator